MPKAEWAMKVEMNRRQHLKEAEIARYKLSLRIHARRAIARMNKEVLDPEKVMFDPITRQWRLLSDEEKLANQMAKAELAEKEANPAITA
jgi:hypothetical protein